MARRGGLSPLLPRPLPQDGGGGPEGLTAQRVGSLAAGLVTNLPEHRGDGAAVPGGARRPGRLLGVGERHDQPPVLEGHRGEGAQRGAPERLVTDLLGTGPALLEAAGGPLQLVAPPVRDPQVVEHLGDPPAVGVRAAERESPAEAGVHLVPMPLGRRLRGQGGHAVGDHPDVGPGGHRHGALEHQLGGGGVAPGGGEASQVGRGGRAGGGVTALQSLLPASNRGLGLAALGSRGTELQEDGTEHLGGAGARELASRAEEGGPEVAVRPGRESAPQSGQGHRAGGGIGRPPLLQGGRDGQLSRRRRAVELLAETPTEQGESPPGGRGLSRQGPVEGPGGGPAAGLQEAQGGQQQGWRRRLRGSCNAG